MEAREACDVVDRQALGDEGDVVVREGRLAEGVGDSCGTAAGEACWLRAVVERKEQGVARSGRCRRGQTTG